MSGNHSCSSVKEVAPVDLAERAGLQRRAMDRLEIRSATDIVAGRE